MSLKGQFVFAKSSIPPTPKYYDFQILSTDLSPMLPMDGLEALSYDYLSTGTKGILTICGWPSVSVKSIFFSTDNGLTVTQLADFPGIARHKFFATECSDGTLFVIGGDKNDQPFGNNDCWRYTKSGVPGQVGTWVKLTSDMGPVFANRIMASYWKGGDGFIYCFCGQFDNSGGPFMDVIRIPELTTLGNDWAFVHDLTSFFAINNIVSLSNTSVSFDGTDIIITGGGLYTGAFITNTYNDKVIKGSNSGTIWSVQSSGFLSGQYANGVYHFGKHWVLFGVNIGINNTKGLYYTSDKGITYTKMYDAPRARHASTLFIHMDNKIHTIAGNLWNDSYAIEEKVIPYYIADVSYGDWSLKDAWLFYQDKPTASLMNGINNFFLGCQIDENIPKLESVYMTWGKTTSDSRSRFWKRNKINTGPDSQQYHTYDLAVDNGVNWLTNSNPNDVRLQGNGHNVLNLDWNVVDDKVNSSTTNCGLVVWPISNSTDGGDAGFFAGSMGSAIFGVDQTNYTIIALNSAQVLINPPLTQGKFMAIWRTDALHLNFQHDNTVTQYSAPLDETYADQDYRFGGTQSLGFTGSIETIVIATTGDCDFAKLKIRLANLEADLGIIRS